MVETPTETATPTSENPASENPTAEIWAAKQLADVARQFETHRTGRAPNSVTSVMVDNKLVITLRGALSTAEQEAAKTPDGAAQIREAHRQLFLTTCDSLRQEVATIVGVAVLEATSEVTTLNGTVVLDFLLATGVVASTWTESKMEPTSLDSSGSKEKPDVGGEG